MKILKSETGQVMVLTVLVLSLTSLASGMIATFLTSSQLRQVRGLSESTRAVYAADAGIEYELYRKFGDNSYTYNLPANADGSFSLTNGATFKTESVGSSIKSLGSFRNARRAFSLSF
jgi:hypothetical protein